MPRDLMYDFANTYGLQRKQPPTGPPNPSQALVRALTRKGLTYEDYVNQGGNDRYSGDNVFMGPGGAFSKMALISQASPTMSALVNSALQPLFAQGLPPDVLFNAMLAAFQRQY